MASEKYSPPADRDPEAALPALDQPTSQPTSQPAPHDHARDKNGLSAEDEAMAMVGEQHHALDPAVVARAVRKIDWFLIPAMIFGCEPPYLPTHVSPPS